MKDQEGYGVITEQGNLGLGFEELSEEDSKKVKESQEKEK